MKSLILASGFGTRLYPVTRTKPKSLLEYQGKPLISHIVGKIPGHLDILVNTNERFKNDFLHWQTTIERQVTLCVESVHTEEQSLGAIGSLAYWVRVKDIDDDLLVIAGDNYFEFDLPRFISFYDGKNPLVAACKIGDRSKAKQFGVLQLNGDRIIQFEEKPTDPKSDLISTACWILPKRVFPILFEFCIEGRKDNLGGFMAHLVKIDKVRAFVFNELWFDIGSH